MVVCYGIITNSKASLGARLIMNTPLFIPVILGKARQGRMSEYVARFVSDQVSKQPNVETEPLAALG